MQLKSRSNSQHRNVFFFLSNGIGRGHKQKIDNLENKEGGADKKKNASKSQLISQKQHVQNAFLSGKRVGAEQHQKNNNIKRRHIASTACLLMLTNTHIRCEEARTQRSKLWRLHPPTRALFLFSFLFFFSWPFFCCCFTIAPFTVHAHFATEKCVFTEEGERKGGKQKKKWKEKTINDKDTVLRRPTN